jgi:hypothetical protein
VSFAGGKGTANMVEGGPLAAWPRWMRLVPFVLT